MKRLIIVMIFIGLRYSNAQIEKFRGTWINIELYNSMQLPKSRIELDSIIPRCIYINSSNKLTIEFRYEQKSNPVVIRKMYSKNGKKAFDVLNRSFTGINDSVMLLSTSGQKTYFKKISNEATVGDGLQAMFRNYFWSNFKKWQLVTIVNNNSKDTVSAYVSRIKISGLKYNPLFKNYDFLDTEMYQLQGENLFGIDFFTVNHNYMATSNSIFAIKKVDTKIYLYKDGNLRYILIPIE